MMNDKPSLFLFLALFFLLGHDPARAEVHNVIIICDPVAPGCPVTLSLDPVTVAEGDQVNWTVSASCSVAPCPAVHPEPTAPCPAGGGAGSFCVQVPGLGFLPETIPPGGNSTNTAPIPAQHPLAYPYMVSDGTTIFYGILAFGPLPSYPFIDDFDDGVISPRYTVFGGATMQEMGGRLIVTMPTAGSGLQIDTSDLPDQTCYRLDYDIPDDSFSVGTELEFSWISHSVTTPGLDFAGVAFSMERPFWNRCEYKVKDKDNESRLIGFTGGIKRKEDCPTGSRISLDWLAKDSQECLDEGGDGTKQCYEIEIADDPDKPTPSVSLTNAVRVEGKEYKSGKIPVFSHSKNKAITAEFERVQSGENATARSGSASLVVAVDTLTVENVHQGSAEQVVSIDPDVFDRGDSLIIDITTAPGVLVDGVSTLNMGADVFIESFDILSDTSATATIEVDVRARNAGHWVIVETNDKLFSSDFVIQPVDPLTPPPPNDAPSLEVIAPPSVPENAPFNIQTIWADADDQWIQAVTVIMELSTTAEVFGSGSFFVDTAGGQPVQVDFPIPGLPTGQYKIVAVADDGLALEEPVELFLSVGEPIPTVSEWGLIVMLLLALTAGTIVFARRRRPAVA